MTTRSRDLTLIVAGGLILIAGAIWLSLGEKEDSTDVLAESRSLARARRFDQAESVLDRHLRSHATDLQAHLLLAQIVTDRPDPKPELALDHLSRIHPDRKALAALVLFFTGKAEHQRSRYLKAEECWRKALEIDPSVPEAGSALLDLMEREGRLEEAYRLGLRLYEIESDPRDRVRLLLELARLDLERPDPEFVARLLEPLVREDPAHLQRAASLGLALIHSSRTDEGVEVLRAMLRRHPDFPEAWDAWLTGLDYAGRPEELAREFSLLPEALASDPRFVKFAGMVAQGKHDWRAAVEAYERALDREPYHAVILYRLSRVYRLLGSSQEGDRSHQRLKTYQDAYMTLNKVVYEAMAVKDLAVKPHVELYQQLAELRERMGRFDEARAWHKLILVDNPRHVPSLLALERLK